jgi:hypothetical protein
MSIEFDEKGKFYTDIISKVTVPATIQTMTHLIYGLVHVRPYGRFKDELDRDEPFLAVTSAKVLDQNGQTIHQTDFMVVARSQIVWVIPEEDKAQAPEEEA